jgi:site-specific DNA-cytosine methylase
MLRELRKLLRAAGYVFHASTHDCGEIGGLAQHRKRYLLVARRPGALPSLLYQPPHRRVRGVGEVLGALPLPATVEARAWGDLHTMPRLSWRNWLRLALIPAGGDWRDLEGVLEGRARREVFRRHAVQPWGAPIPAVTGPGGHSVEAVADPRVEGTYHAGVYGVTPWDGTSPTVTGGANPSKGRFAVADPRVAMPPSEARHTSKLHVLGWDAAARTVIGAYAVADGRDRAALDEVVVLTLDEAMALEGLDPKKPPPFVPVIVAEDGTWHRPLTLLELAVLQGLPATVDGVPLQLAGTRTQRAEHVGNAVPVGAARAIAERMLVTLAEGALNEFTLASASTPVWVDRDVTPSNVEARDA